MDKPALRSKILPPTCRGSSEALLTPFHLTGSASRAGSTLRFGRIAVEDSGLIIRCVSQTCIDQTYQTMH